MATSHVICRRAWSAWAQLARPSQFRLSHSKTFMRQASSGRTLTEKIVQRHACEEGAAPRPGDYITVSPSFCMTHDNTRAVMSKFLQLGATTVHSPSQLVFTLDHDTQNTSPANLRKYAEIAAFAAEHGVTAYPKGRGIGHQIMVEEGYAWPGTMVVASDSHSNMYGAMGCLGTPIVRTDAMAIWQGGRTWYQLAPVARLTLTGKLPTGVTGKDVILALCSLFPRDVLNHAVEIGGAAETLASIPIDSRLTISNMSTEWGALSCLFPVDETLEHWLRDRADKANGNTDTEKRINHKRIDQLFADSPRADDNAVYAKQLYLDLSTLSPYVTGPNAVDLATPLHELAPKNIKIDRAYLVSCTNARASDLKAAATVFRNAVNPKVAEGVEFYISAASAPEQKVAEAAGDWQVLVDAGARPMPSGCAQCIGLGTGLLEAGQTGISASNRNFKGRMGSRDAQAYLASPEIVAASALRGTITGPGVYQVPANWSGVTHGYGTGAELSTEDQLSHFTQQLDSLIDRVESAADASGDTQSNMLPDFPDKIAGEITWLDYDNLSTDGIFPGTLTYRDNITTEEMAKACMQNYDPEFDSLARPFDILVSGYNFGTGSSREQAATSILAKEIPLVVAGSFSSTFARNAINNALLNLSVPRLVERLRTCFPRGDKAVLTRRTGWTLMWDVRRSIVEVREADGTTWTEKVGELSATVQAIIAAGGLEAFTKAEVARKSKEAAQLQE